MQADLDLIGQIRSRERVRDRAEVYTRKREVDAMLDLVPDVFHDIDSRFLEPACGHGNFLVAILSRKLLVIDEERHGGTPNWYESAALRAVASIYAIDNCDENVVEARERMHAVLDKEFAEKGYEPTPQFDRVTGSRYSVAAVFALLVSRARMTWSSSWPPGSLGSTATA